MSGGGGLLSTMGDYARFCEMLRRGGELDGERILGPETLRFMTRNHLPGGAAMSDIAVGTLGDVGYEGVGFGLGFATTLDPVAAGVIGSPATSTGAAPRARSSGSTRCRTCS